MHNKNIKVEIGNEEMRTNDLRMLLLVAEEAIKIIVNFLVAKLRWETLGIEKFRF